MKKFLSLLAVLMIGTVTAVAQNIHPYQCGVVNNADILLGIDVHSLSQASSVKQVKALGQNLLQGAQSKDAQKIRKFFATLGITEQNWDQVVGHCMISVALNGMSLDAPAPQKIDAIVAVLLKQPINFKALPGAIRTLEKESGEDFSLSISRKQYKNANAYVFTDTSEEADPDFKHFVVAMVGNDVIFIGEKKSVDRAMNRIDTRKLAANMDPFLFGQDGHVQFVMRMIPELKKQVSAMAATTPGMDVLANSKGFAVTLSATDKFALNVALNTASQAAANNFKAQVWDTQVAPIVGALSQMAKAQTNNQFNVLDSLKCTIKGAVLNVSVAFTLQDIITGIQLFEKMEAEKAATK